MRVEVRISALEQKTDSLSDHHVPAAIRRRFDAAEIENKSVYQLSKNAYHPCWPIAFDVKLTRATTPREVTVAAAEQRLSPTALSTKLDPEDLRGIVGADHPGCTELIERNGGFVARYVGGGAPSYFGYRRAHKHDAEPAVRAGT